MGLWTKVLFCSCVVFRSQSKIEMLTQEFLRHRKNSSPHWPLLRVGHVENAKKAPNIPHQRVQTRALKPTLFRPLRWASIRFLLTPRYSTNHTTTTPVFIPADRLHLRHLSQLSESAPLVNLYYYRGTDHLALPSKSQEPGKKIHRTARMTSGELRDTRTK